VFGYCAHRGPGVRRSRQVWAVADGRLAEKERFVDVTPGHSAYFIAYQPGELDTYERGNNWSSIRPGPLHLAHRDRGVFIARLAPDAGREAVWRAWKHPATPGFAADPNTGRAAIKSAPPFPSQLSRSDSPSSSTPSSLAKSRQRPWVTKPHGVSQSARFRRTHTSIDPSE